MLGERLWYIDILIFKCYEKSKSKTRNIPLPDATRRGRIGGGRYVQLHARQLLRNRSTQTADDINNIGQEPLHEPRDQKEPSFQRQYSVCRND